MNRFISKLTRWLPVAAAGLVFFAPARMVGQQEQPILFSSPDNDDIGTNMPSLTPRPPDLPDAAQGGQAAMFNFNAGPITPPSLGGSLSPQQVAEREKELDEKENWALLTPREILGVPTTEQILGIHEDDNKSVMERYLERQEAPVTNGVAGLTQWDLPAGESNAAAATAAVLGSIDPAANAYFSQMMGNLAANQAQNANNSWFNFNPGSPAATPAPTPEQVAAEEEAFQKMITLHSALPLPSPTEPLFNANPFNVQLKPVSAAIQPAPDPLTATPQANPLGTSFAPLNGQAHMPVGVKPLPGLIPQNPTPVVPEWKPQMPPWMSPVPEPGQIH